LGVCEAIGEDFGFSPVLLRVPFAATVLYSPTLAIAAYLGLGAVVLASRLLFPKPKFDTVAVKQPQAGNDEAEYAQAA
jgi:hypothetical protein